MHGGWAMGIRAGFSLVGFDIVVHSERHNTSLSILM
jgi:hypothetical protein